jgi:hypothetical protein
MQRVDIETARAPMTAEQSPTEVAVRRGLPLVIALVALFAAVWSLYQASIVHTDGQFIYTLDDSYIHMAMAKHFAQNGTWGVTPYAFSSSSSSLLWTLLLGLLYAVFGVHDLLPLLLNVLFAALTLVVIYQGLLSRGAPPLFAFAVLLVIIFLTGFDSLIFTGMEHTLQIFLIVLFVSSAARMLSQQVIQPFSRSGAALAVVGMLCVFVRYEGLFLIAMVSLLFALRRHVRYAILLGLLGASPIVLFGLLALANGWMFLPNPVLLGGRQFDFRTIQGLLSIFGLGAYQQLQSNIHLWLLMMGALVLFVTETSVRRTLWQDTVLVLFLFLGVTFLHLELTSKSVWVYRHEAYLLVLGIFVLGAALGGKLPSAYRFRSFDTLRYAAVGLLVVLLSLPLLERSLYLRVITPQASQNIYEQQMQMALFLHDYYPEESVAANDIGLINYLTPLHLLDLYGLANLPIGQAMRAGSYDTALIQSLVEQENVSIAVVYTGWFDAYGGVPPEWVNVGEWTINNNVVVGGNTVAFYATSADGVEKLRQALQEFNPRLPATVSPSGLYVELADPQS